MGGHNCDSIQKRAPASWGVLYRYASPARAAAQERWICAAPLAAALVGVGVHSGGSARACHPTADSAPRSAGAGHRSIRLQQVDRKYGCQDFQWRSAAPRRDYLNAT